MKLEFTSGYCCLNSTVIPRSLLLAGYAAVSIETLADQLVAPLGQQLLFSLFDSGDLL